MNLTDNQIEQFTAALLSPAPPWDPDWNISKTLIELVRVQSNKILALEEELAAGRFSANAAINTLSKSIQGGLQQQINPGHLNDEDVKSAIANLNAAIQSAETGQQVVQYAGAVLKFVAKLVA